MQNITKYFINQIFNRFYSLNIRLIVIIAVFSFYSTYNLSVLDGLDCSVFEYALLAMSDHYYIVFFFFLMYSMVIFDLIKDSNPLIKLRAKRYYTYFVSKLVAIVVFTVSIVFLHVLIAILIGSFKHGWNNNFSAELSSVTTYSEVGLIFNGAFRSPFAALLSACLYLSLGLCVFSGILMLVSHFFTEKAVIATEIIVYLLIIITLQLNSDRMAPYLFFVNYLLLHRALGYGLAIVLTLISVMIIFLEIYMANRQHSRILKYISRIFLPLKIFGEVFTYKKIITFVLITFLLAVLNIIKYKANVNSGLEYTIMTFMGYGLGYINIIDFLQLIILNGIPVYILSAYFGDKASMRGILIIRYRFTRKWFSRIQFSMFVLILFQLALICLFTFLMSTIGISSGFLQMNNAGMLSMISNPLKTLVLGFALRVLEIMFLQMIFLVLFSVAKNIIGSFLVTIGLYFSIMFFDGKFIPFGLSSLSRLFELSENSLLINTIVPTIIFVSAYVVMYVYMIKSKAVRTLISERSYI